MKYLVRITPIALDDAEEFYLWISQDSPVNGAMDYLQLQIGYQWKEIKNLLTANCHQTWNKNPTPNPLIAYGEGAGMYLIWLEIAVNERIKSFKLT
jgi:hypothetical protein